MGNSLTHRFVDVNGIRLHLAELGEEDAIVGGHGAQPATSGCQQDDR